MLVRDRMEFARRSYRFLSGPLSREWFTEKGIYRSPTRGPSYVSVGFYHHASYMIAERCLRVGFYEFYTSFCEGSQLGEGYRHGELVAAVQRVGPK